jgi:outer membrane protein insertion porin family
MASKEGEIFNRSLLARDIQAITDVYYDSGYAYANPVPVTAVNAEAKTIDLTFDVNKGKQVTIERIDVVGNTKTRDKVIRRQLRVFEGELFSGSGMRRSKEKVTALGLLRDRRGDAQARPRRRARAGDGRGEGEVDGHVPGRPGLLEHRELHLHRAGRAAELRGLGPGGLVLGAAVGPAQFFQASYFDPYFLDTNFIFSLDAYRTQLDYFGFVRDAYGGTRASATTSSPTRCRSTSGTRASSCASSRAASRCCSPISSAAATRARCAPAGCGTSATTASSRRRAGS